MVAWGWWLGAGRRGYDRLQRDEIESDEYVHYLDCDEGFPGENMWKFIKLYNLNMCNLLYVTYFFNKAVENNTNIVK